MLFDSKPGEFHWGKIALAALGGIAIALIIGVPIALLLLHHMESVRMFFAGLF